MTHGRSFEEMEKIGEVFIEKAVKRGVTEQVAGEIFKCIRGYIATASRPTPGRLPPLRTRHLIEHYPAEFCGAIPTTSLWILPCVHYMR